MFQQKRHRLLNPLFKTGHNFAYTRGQHFLAFLRRGGERARTFNQRPAGEREGVPVPLTALQEKSFYRVYGIRGIVLQRVLRGSFRRVHGESFLLRVHRGAFSTGYKEIILFQSGFLKVRPVYDTAYERMSGKLVRMSHCSRDMEKVECQRLPDSSRRLSV